VVVGPALAAPHDARPAQTPQPIRTARDGLSFLLPQPNRPAINVLLRNT
jgi:hypothetical protein